jgi:hypothetical protein
LGDDVVCPWSCTLLVLAAEPPPPPTPLSTLSLFLFWGVPPSPPNRCCCCIVCTNLGFEGMLSLMIFFTDESSSFSPSSSCHCCCLPPLWGPGIFSRVLVIGTFIDLMIKVRGGNIFGTPIMWLPCDFIFPDNMCCWASLVMEICTSISFSCIVEKLQPGLMSRADPWSS